jgi:HSP20 family molecular chaperone IbpA
MKTLLISLAALVIGLFVGIAFAKHWGWHTESVDLSADIPASPADPQAALPAANDWDPFTEMRQMQEQMNRAINQSIERFRNEPKFNRFTGIPGYSLSLDVREFKDRFEVHAALPDAKASDVNVKLEDDRTLRVEVSNKTTGNSQQGSASTTTESWGRYAQTIQLPSAVQDPKMKVEHNDHELLIILPKA